MIPIMFTASRSAVVLTLSALALAFVAGCVSKVPAPVEVRTPAQGPAPAPVVTAPSVSASSSSAAPVVRPGYYIVKKGDTLYSIALEHGHDYRDVAAWNNIANPAQISVGQELRVAPPGSEPQSQSSPALGTQPVIVPRIEERSSGVASPVNDGGVVNEPRGGRVAWSDKAWRDLQPQSAALAQSQPAAQSAPLAQSSPAAKPAASAPVAEPVRSEWVWPANGKVIASFSEGSKKGIDIGGNIGDPVLAAAAGEVSYVGAALRGYGNLVIIKHGTKYTTVYAHNKEILVKERQQVQKGQKIAVMGDSDTDRPKLHFELRDNGTPLDPMKLLPTR